MRSATIQRKTAETDISLTLNLDGTGQSDIHTGCGFLDHMLTLLAAHARFDLRVSCTGDTQVDDHHTVEDIGIALGQALRSALGDKRGVRRYGQRLLPMDEVRRLGALPGEQINEAKRVLAFEVTKMIHGEAEAQKAADAALALFAGGAASQDVPTWEVNAAMLAEDNRLTTLLASCGLCTSRGDARKMVQQGAVLVADQKVTDVEYRIDASQIGPDGLMLRKGKKNYCRLILK